MRPSPHIADPSEGENHPTEPSGPVCEIYASNVYPGLATVIRALADGGHKIKLSAPRQTIGAATDHDVTYSLLEKSPEVEMLPLAKNNAPPPDVLLVAWAHQLPYASDHLASLRDRAASARRVILLYDANFGGAKEICGQQVKWFLRDWAWLKRAESVCYVTVVPGFDFFCLAKRRLRLSVGPNIHYLLDPRDREMLFARNWQPDDKRPLRLICTGAKNSDKWRATIIDQLNSDLRNETGAPLISEAPADLRELKGNPILWSFDGRRPALAEYVHISANSDFVLCVPGTSWTHRPFESLARGAIPIVDTTNAKMHDIPWRDGENCVLVPKLRSLESWRETVRRAMAISQDRIVAMRRKIAALRADYLEMPAFSKRLRRKLGL